MIENLVGWLGDEKVFNDSDELLLSAHIQAFVDLFILNLKGLYHVWEVGAQTFTT